MRQFHIVSWFTMAMGKKVSWSYEIESGWGDFSNTDNQNPYSCLVSSNQMELIELIVNTIEIFLSTQNYFYFFSVFLFLLLLQNNHKVYSDRLKVSGVRSPTSFHNLHAFSWALSSEEDPRGWKTFNEEKGLSALSVAICYSQTLYVSLRQKQLFLK